jgi:transcriptional regulator with XRE-family HTH domain
MSNFGERLKYLREQKKLTQWQLAEAFNLTERGYRNYEINQSTPNFEMLVALANYFDVPIDYLIGRSDDPKRR